MRFLAALFLAGALSLAGSAKAAPVDGIADALVTAANKAEITANSLPDDFARLSRFVRRDTGGMAIFSDGGPTDGYVRHAQARDSCIPSRQRSANPNCDQCTSERWRKNSVVALKKCSRLDPRSARGG